MKPIGVGWGRLQHNTPDHREKAYITIRTLVFMDSRGKDKVPRSLLVHHPPTASRDEDIPPPVKASHSARKSQAKPKAAERNVMLVAGLVALFMAPMLIVVYGFLPDEEAASLTNLFVGTVAMGFMFLILGMLIRPPRQQAHPRSMWIEPVEPPTSLYDQANLEANIQERPTTLVFDLPGNTEANENESRRGTLPPIVLVEGTGITGENGESTSNHHRSDDNTGPAVVGWFLLGVFIMVLSIVGGSEALLCGGIFLLDAAFLTAFLPNKQDRKPANGLQSVLVILMLLMILVFIIVFSS